MDSATHPGARSRTNRESVSLPSGAPGDPADFVNAIRNVEAEAGYALGNVLTDTYGGNLPSVLDGLLSFDRQRELLDAAIAMWGFISPKIGCRIGTVLPSPWQREWDLDQLEGVFRRAVDIIAPSARRPLEDANDEGLPFELRGDAVDAASRMVALWSSLVHLAAACARLKLKTSRQTPWTTATAFDA